MDPKVLFDMQTAAYQTHRKNRSNTDKHHPEGNVVDGMWRFIATWRGKVEVESTRTAKPTYPMPAEPAEQGL